MQRLLVGAVAVVVVCSVLLPQATGFDFSGFCRQKCMRGHGGNLCKCNAVHFAGKRTMMTSAQGKPDDVQGLLTAASEADTDESMRKNQDKNMEAFEDQLASALLRQEGRQRMLAGGADWLTGSEDEAGLDAAEYEYEASRLMRNTNLMRALLRDLISRRYPKTV